MDKRTWQKFLSRAGKVTGKYSNRFSVAYQSPDIIRGTEGSVDFNQVENAVVVEQNIESATICDEVLISENEDFSEAKTQE